MQWQAEFNIGIDVIDDQHKRIVEYINELEVIFADDSYRREQVEEVLNNIIDYTQSHFAFEESLLDQANYPYMSPHKSVHAAFIKKIERYRQQFMAGTAIEKDLHKMLLKWLINHIQHDDADYVASVKESMVNYIQKQEAAKGKGWFSRFFSRGH